MLFYESGEGGGPVYASYLRATDGAVPVRLGSGRAMALSADGRFAVSIPIEAPDRIDLLPIGPGEVRSIREPGIAEFQWAGLTPDGLSLVFTGAGASGLPRVYVKPLAGGRARPVTPDGIGLTTNGIAPDGRAVVAGCQSGLCIYPLDGGAARPIADSEKLRRGGLGGTERGDRAGLEHDPGAAPSAGPRHRPPHAVARACRHTTRPACAA